MVRCSNTFGSLELYDLQVGEVIRIRLSNRASVADLPWTSAISPDGEMVALAGFDGAIAVWPFSALVASARDKAR
jgi:hypothetical protein